MLRIDASDGGGQVVRWALAFAAVDGRAVELTGIREARPTDGLRPQHLAAVDLFGQLTDADVGSAAEGSERLVFDPGALAGGEYDVGIGTAGSVPLLYDAVLPVAPALPGPVTVTATGGTDVAWSPPVDYLRRVKLPLLRGAGLRATLSVDRRGFYPAGGGRARLEVEPLDDALDLHLEPESDPATARVYSTATADLRDGEVATRAADAARDRLEDAGIEVVETVRSVVDADSTGSVVVVRLDGGPVPVGFDALGERGRPAEDVGTAAVEEAIAFLDGLGVVDEHMADQLVPFLALSGGRVPVPAVTDHLETGVAVARAFGHDVRVDRRADGPVLAG